MSDTQILLSLDDLENNFVLPSNSTMSEVSQYKESRLMKLSHQHQDKHQKLTFLFDAHHLDLIPNSELQLIVVLGAVGIENSGELVHHWVLRCVSNRERDYDP